MFENPLRRLELKRQRIHHGVLERVCPEDRIVHVDGAKAVAEVTAAALVAIDALGRS